MDGKLVRKYGPFEIWEHGGKYFGIDTENPSAKPRPYRTLEYADKIARAAYEWEKNNHE